MSPKPSICLFLLATVVVSIDAHGYMIDPAARGAVFLLNNSTAFPTTVFPSLFTNNEWCDDGRPTKMRNVRCGVCGPIYNNDPGFFGPFMLNAGGKTFTVTSYERNSFSFRNVPSMSKYIVKTYKKGELIRPKMMGVDPIGGSGNHNGTIEFRVCEVTNPSVDPTNDCFNQNPLRFANGQTVMQFNDAEIVNRNTNRMAFVYSVKLPENLVCNHCLLQMRWIGVNTQRYYGCADIRIEQTAETDPARNAFDEIDTDKNSYVVVSEARDWMMRSDMPQEGLDAIFGQYDTDKDGKVSFEEWKQARQ